MVGIFVTSDCRLPKVQERIDANGCRPKTVAGPSRTLYPSLYGCVAQCCLGDRCQGTAETLHTIQTLLLKLIKRGELVFRRQTVAFGVLRETLIEARAGREVYFEDIVERPWLEKGKTRETMKNYFDMKARNTTDYVEQVIDKIKNDEANKT